MSRSPLQLAATLVGLAFLLAGVGGFIPGITYDASEITLYGHDSPAKLLGVFQVSVLHNVIHLVLGLAGLAMAKSSPRLYLVGGGLIYAATWLYGLLIDPMSQLNFVPLNDADNWLHLASSAAMLLLGVVLGKTATAPKV